MEKKSEPDEIEQDDQVPRTIEVAEIAESEAIVSISIGNESVDYTTGSSRSTMLHPTGSVRTESSIAAQDRAPINFAQPFSTSEDFRQEENAAKDESSQQQLGWDYHEAVNFDHYQQLTFKILCPQSVVGLIIGKGGTAINELNSRSGAKITLSQNTEFYPGTEDRIIMMQGDRAGITTALNSLVKRIVEAPEKKMNRSRSDSYGSADFQRSGGLSPDKPFKIGLLIPLYAAGNIIGKGGSTIKRLCSASKCMMQADDNSDPYSTRERIFSVIGQTSDAVVSGSLMLFDQFLAEPNVCYYENMSTVYFGTQEDIHTSNSHSHSQSSMSSIMTASSTGAYPGTGLTLLSAGRSNSSQYSRSSGGVLSPRQSASNSGSFMIVPMVNTSTAGAMNLNMGPVSPSQHLQMPNTNHLGYVTGASAPMSYLDAGSAGVSNSGMNQDMFAFAGSRYGYHSSPRNSVGAASGGVGMAAFPPSAAYQQQQQHQMLHPNQAPMVNMMQPPVHMNSQPLQQQQMSPSYQQYPQQHLPQQQQQQYFTGPPVPDMMRMMNATPHLSPTVYGLPNSPPFQDTMQYQQQQQQYLPQQLHQPMQHQYQQYQQQQNSPTQQPLQLPPGALLHRRSVGQLNCPIPQVTEPDPSQLGHGSPAHPHQQAPR